MYWNWYGKIRIFFYILRHPVRVTVSSCQLMLCLRTDDANFLWPCHVTVSCDCYEIWSRSLGVIILKKFDMYVTYVIVPTIPFEQFWLTWKKDFDMSQVAQKNCYIFTWPTKTTVKLARQGGCLSVSSRYLNVITLLELA